MKNTYTLMIKQLDSLLDNETNLIANLSNASALIYQTLEELNWVGFYLYDKDKNELVLGPFQGNVACMHIPMNQGVCGTAAYQNESIVVNDVHQFPGHIACDSASESEIVIPITINSSLFGVLDIDAPIKNRFNEMDRLYLESFVDVLKRHIS